MSFIGLGQVGPKGRLSHIGPPLALFLLHFVALYFDQFSVKASLRTAHYGVPHHREWPEAVGARLWP